MKELEKPSFRMGVCLLMHQNWHRQVKKVSQEVMKRGLWICRSQILEVIVLFQTRYADRATEKTVPPSEFRRWTCKSRSGAMKSEAGGGRSAWSDEQRREFSSLWVIGGGEVRKWGGQTASPCQYRRRDSVKRGARSFSSTWASDSNHLTDWSSLRCHTSSPFSMAHRGPTPPR